MTQSFRPYRARIVDAIVDAVGDAATVIVPDDGPGMTNHVHLRAAVDGTPAGATVIVDLQRDYVVVRPVGGGARDFRRASYADGVAVAAAAAYAAAALTDGTVTR